MTQQWKDLITYYALVEKPADQNCVHKNDAFLVMQRMCLQPLVMDCLVQVVFASIVLLDKGKSISVMTLVKVMSH